MCSCLRQSMYLTQRTVTVQRTVLIVCAVHPVHCHCEAATVHLSVERRTDVDAQPRKTTGMSPPDTAARQRWGRSDADSRRERQATPRGRQRREQPRRRPLRSPAPPSLCSSRNTRNTTKPNTQRPQRPHGTRKAQAADHTLRHTAGNRQHTADSAARGTVRKGQHTMPDSRARCDVRAEPRHSTPLHRSPGAWLGLVLLVGGVWCPLDRPASTRLGQSRTAASAAVECCLSRRL